MQAKLFLIYLRCRKPVILISGAIAKLAAGIALILVSLNTWLEYKTRTAVYPTWQVVEIETGNTFTVIHEDETKIISLCGVAEGNKEYLESVIDKGDGTVELEKAGDAYEAWVMLAPDREQQIHINTWMVQHGMAKLDSSSSQCRSDVELEMAQAIALRALAKPIAKKDKLGIWSNQ